MIAGQSGSIGIGFASIGIGLGAGIGALMVGICIINCNSVVRRAASKMDSVGSLAHGEMVHAKVDQLPQPGSRAASQQGRVASAYQSQLPPAVRLPSPPPNRQFTPSPTRQALHSPGCETVDLPSPSQPPPGARHLSPSSGQLPSQRQYLQSPSRRLPSQRSLPPPAYSDQNLIGRPPSRGLTLPSAPPRGDSIGYEEQPDIQRI